MKSLQYLIIIIAIVFKVNCFGQNNFTNDCIINEKSIIKTDRDIYIAGEKVLVSIDYSILSPEYLKDFSKILYVELINLNNNYSVIKKIYKITDSNVSGEIEIPKETQTGNYMLISYTQFQRNFHQTFSGSKTISIFNQEYKPQKTKNINDIDSIIIVSQNSGLSFLNAQRSFVIHIPLKYLKLGNRFMVFFKDSGIETINPDSMGLYRLNCTDHNPEKLIIIDNANDTLIKKFPDVKQKEMLTSLNNGNGDYTYCINTNHAKTDYKLTVLNSYRKEIFCKSIQVDSSYKIVINQSKLTEGINYFILQDLQSNVVDFKSLIINRKPKEISIHSSKDTFTTQEFGRFKFKSNDNSSSILPFVSISVIRKNSKLSTAPFIPNYHLLHPCILEDFIRQNNIYDELTLSCMSALLDNSFEPELIKETIPKSNSHSLSYMPEIRDFTLKGTLTSSIDKNPIPNAELGISVLTKNPQIHFSKTNLLGEFFFILNDLYDENQIFLTLLDDQNRYVDAKISLLSPFIGELPRIKDSPFFFDDKNKDLINELSFNHQINTRFGNVNYSKVIDNIYKDSLLNIAAPRYIVSLNDYIKLESIKELFNGIVPFVKIRNIGEKETLKVFNENGKMYNGEPLLLIDNIPFYDFESLRNIEISQIKSIEVINKQYVFGNYTFNGIVHLRTNSKNFGNVKIPKISAFSNIQCAEKPLEYLLSPKINNMEDTPDYRTVLLWNPRIKLGYDYQELHFFTSDRKGFYDIIVTGYDEFGNTYSGKKQILVN